ncbi:hypothetical protein INT48_004552, partial [Thamnidium elegans]
VSKKNLTSLEELADEEQGLYISIRRERIKKQNEVRSNVVAWPKKFEHFKWIAANQVFDFSDKSSNSQCDNLHEDTRLEFERLYRKEFSIKSAVTKKLSDIMNSSNSLQDKLSKFEKVNATNNNERAQKEIFGFIETRVTFQLRVLTIYLRGDTVSDSLSKVNIISKMDLRVTGASASLYYSITEFAKKCTTRKYYLDKLKLLLQN